jgi:hypothetical protein
MLPIFMVGKRLRLLRSLSESLDINLFTSA